MIAARGTSRLLPAAMRSSLLSSGPVQAPQRYQHVALRSVGTKKVVRRGGEHQRLSKAKKILQSEPTSRAATEEGSAASTEASAAAAEPPLVKSVDPHQMADEFIRKSKGGLAPRMQGTDALASLTSEQKMRNFGTAAGLLAFVTWVWWYSMQSVGKAEGGIEELQAEADEARQAAEQKKMSEREAEELVDLEVTTSAMMKEQGVEIAIAAPDDVASEEEGRALDKAAGDGGSGRRPLWRRIVFFWRKE